VISIVTKFGNREQLTRNDHFRSEMEKMKMCYSSSTGSNAANMVNDIHTAYSG